MSAEQHWAQDKLGRKDDAHFLIKFLLNRIEERGEMGKPKSYVLNIDAQWGDGKTFFLKGLKAQLFEEGYPVAYVDAWADDHADDPMIAVVSAIDQVVAPLLGADENLTADWAKVRAATSRIVRSAGIGVLKQIGKRIFGESADVLASELGGLKDQFDGATDAGSKALGDEIDIFFDEQKEIRTFRETLSSVLAALEGNDSQKLPLFVLIDELDRCRPPYAIAMLERVKHLFDIDEVVFVIATDSEQLHHAIRSVYGSEFASDRYLSRFFDRSFRFEEPSHAEFVARLFAEYPLPTELLASPPEKSHEAFFCDVANEFALSLRDIEQAFDVFRSVITVWDFESRIETAVLLPLIAMWQTNHDEMYSAFIDESAFRDFVVRNYSSASKCLAFAYYDQDGRTKYQDLTIGELLLQIIARCNKDLPSSTNSRNPNGVAAWIDNIMLNEYRAIHNNSHNRHSPPYSVLREYPQIIRNLQRIAQQDDDPTAV